MGLTFEWDPQKAARNLRIRQVSFEEASTVFDDALSATVNDPDHSEEEDWYLIIGFSRQQRLLIVSFTERGERIRIISARTLTGKERREYEEIGD